MLHALQGALFERSSPGDVQLDRSPRADEHCQAFCRGPSLRGQQRGVGGGSAPKAPRTARGGAARRQLQTLLPGCAIRANASLECRAKSHLLHRIPGRGCTVRMVLSFLGVKVKTATCLARLGRCGCSRGRRSSGRGVPLALRALRGGAGRRRPSCRSPRARPCASESVSGVVRIFTLLVMFFTLFVA